MKKVRALNGVSFTRLLPSRIPLSPDAPLTKAVSDRCFEILSFNADPRFVPLRKDPRFAKLVKQVGLGSSAPASATPTVSRQR